jgi:cobyrinic acid a,c-diamide synthase
MSSRKVDRGGHTSLLIKLYDVGLPLYQPNSQVKIKVQAFKKGPDYIDPIWLAQASGNPCYNLDFYTMPENEISALFHQQQSDIARHKP